MDDDYQRALHDLTSLGTSHPPSINETGSALPSNPLLDLTELPSSNPPPAQGSDSEKNKNPSGIIPTLQNIVATCSLGCALDLKRIAQHARNAEYNPKRFAAVIMRIRDPKTTALIFSSGKMVCTGAKSEQESRLAARKYAKIVMKLGYSVTFHDFKIQNIVGSCDVKFPIGLEQLNFKHSLFTRYEPELFPGLVYKMKSPKVVILVFVSGKIVLTGAKKRTEIYQAFENIYPTLTKFRKCRKKPAEESPRDERQVRMPVVSPSTHNNTQSIRSGENREHQNPVSPMLSSMASVPEEWPSIQPSMNSDYHSPFFPDTFHSQQSPHSIHFGSSGDLRSLQLQSPSTPSASGHPTTSLVYSIRPPTSQG